MENVDENRGLEYRKNRNIDPIDQAILWEKIRSYNKIKIYLSME